MLIKQNHHLSESIFVYHYETGPTGLLYVFINNY